MWKRFFRLSFLIGSCSQSDQPISTDELMACFNISTDQIQRAQPPEPAKMKVEEAISNPGRLLELYKDLVLEQKALRSEYMQELASNVQEDQLAAARKEDRTPVVYMAIKALAEAGVLKDIVRDLRGDQSQA
jgi:ubiquitin carboxyl-terminal hydrolase L5